MRQFIAILLIAAVLVLAYRLLPSERPASAPMVQTPAHSNPVLADAGAPDTRVIREQIPRPVPEEAVHIELTEPAATRYGATQPTEADAVYASLVEALGRPDVIYDPALGHAARELAFQHSEIGGLVPQDIVDFLLRSAGAVDRTVTQGYTNASGDELGAVTERLRSLLGPRPAGGPVQRVGIGEAYIPGAKRPRFIAMLVSRRQIDVQPAPRRVELGTEWVLVGTLPEHFEAPHGLVLRPDGRLESIPVDHSGRRFTLRVPAGEDSGVLDISLGATGPFGPKPLLQVSVSVGVPIPNAYDSALLADESELTAAPAAELLAFGLLNADRRRFGLRPLVRDATLDSIARAHSTDMRDNRFFGHYSDLSGTPSDRLAEAGYRVGLHGENVASGQSIHGAEKGLMHSLGHRRNILQPGFTHVGIGVAGRRERGHTQWYLTQLFARPVERLDEPVARAALRARMNDQRKALGRAALADDPALDAIGETGAESVARGGGEGLASQLLARAKAKALLRGGAYVWLRATVALDDMALPKEASSADFRRVGIGLEQLPDHPNGLIGVVLILSGGAP